MNALWVKINAPMIIDRTHQSLTNDKTKEIPKFFKQSIRY